MYARSRESRGPSQHGFQIDCCQIVTCLRSNLLSRSKDQRFIDGEEKKKENNPRSLSDRLYSRFISDTRLIKIYLVVTWEFYPVFREYNRKFVSVSILVARGSYDCSTRSRYENRTTISRIVFDRSSMFNTRRFCY